MNKDNLPAVNFKYYWNYTIGGFYKELMLPCILTSVHCKNCNESYILQSNIIKIPLEAVLSQELENHIVNAISESYGCGKCFQIMSDKIEVSNLLCLDTENSDRDSGSTFNINEIRKNLQVKEKNFHLGGVITYNEPISLENERHYVSYFKKLENDKWLKFDDSETAKTPITVGSNNINAKIALILYVEL